MVNNKKLQKKPENEKIAVILLGAGAAKAWGGPLSSDIERIIKEADRYTALTENISVGKFVWEELKKFYRDKESVNFETFLGVLEFLLDYNLSKTNEGSTSPANTSFIPAICSLNSIYAELKGRVCPSNPPDDRIFFSDLLKYYYELVAKEIEKYILKIKEEENSQINEELKNFILYLKKNNYKIRAYTTNYDRLFPILLRDELQIFDGFNFNDSKHVEDSINYDVNKILHDKNCNTYYNLHGCLYWERNFDASQLESKFVCKPHQTYTSIDFSKMETANPGHAIFPINIVTGYNKVQRLSLEPLNLFYSIFLSDCNDADFIITTGYSFNDYHINRALSLGLNKTHIPHLHITFKDKNSYKTPVDIKNLSDILRLTSNNLIVKSEHDIWLKSNDNNRIVYLKGFKNFLLNKEWLSICKNELKDKHFL